jgi:hypothetical protein
MALRPNRRLFKRFRACLPLLVLLAGCSDSAWEVREVRAEPPLARVTYAGPSLSVYPAAGVDWKSLIDLPFEALRPGMTFDEARARLGPPDVTSRNSMGPYIAYRRPWGSLQVGHERQSSGDASYEFWSLRAYPVHSTAKDFLHPSILKYLDPQAERTEVFLTRNEETVLQVILLRGLQIQSINWFKE